MKLMVQFVNLRPGSLQSSLARRGDPVNPAPSVLQFRLQKPPAFHSVQQWVERPRSDVIAMVLQLLHHRQSEYRLVSGVQEHMDANESGKEVPLMC